MGHHYSLSAVRRSLIHFVFGKALNGILGLLTIVLLVRELSTIDYGVFIALAAFQLSFLALSNLGIETTAERFLPELRGRYQDNELCGFVLIALVARFISLLVAIAVGYALSAWIVELFGFATYLVHFRLWLLVILSSGMLAMSVALLEAMLRQRHAQFCMMVYTGLRCLTIVISLQFVRFDLMALVWIELLANGLAACTGALLMLRSFPVRGWREGWYIVGLHKTRFCRFAAYNYSAQLVFQFFNAEAMKLLVTRLLGMVQAARYGFVYNLADTVQRYLPAQLLLRLVKPVFVSRYQQSRDFAQLNGMARLILKLNLLMLSPIIVFFAVYGEAALRIVSGGKYQDLQWLLVGLLCLLITNSHQQVLSLLASTLERNAMQLHAGLLSLLALPCAVFLVPLFGAPGAIVSSAIGGLIYNTFATIYLRSAGYAYRPDLRAVAVFLLAGAAFGGTALVVERYIPGWWGAVLAVTIGMPVYWAVVRGLRAFQDEERLVLNSVLPKKVFFF